MVDSFRSWLIAHINAVLTRPSSPAPLVLWCDPGREWLGLLFDAADAGGFELWADPDEHELLLRDRFYATERRPRVVWRPCARQDITWFEVVALQADAVWEKTLLQALREYGVAIPRDLEAELVPLLPAHAREWFDEPKETWKELTPVTAKSTLVTDSRLLQVLAGGPGEFERLRQEERFGIFCRRAVEDFGLPDPAAQAEEAWRIAATARLLCTEAAEAHPDQPPTEGERIIPPGLARDRALELLCNWQSNVHLMPAVERLVPLADATVGLTYWARNLPTPPRSSSSRAVEETLFGKIAEELDRIEQVDSLAQELAGRLPALADREAGFWGRLATHRVGWSYLVGLARAAGRLVHNAEVEKSWQTAEEAIRWYTGGGWQLDWAGETLFEEQRDLPAQLHRIRARLRRCYLRAVDRIGSAFSERLAHEPRALRALRTPGELALVELEKSDGPTALVFLDALRFDLGQRLAELLNGGEPGRRAEVTAAAAPVPSITELGMAFALPLKRDQLRVEVVPPKGFRVRGTDPAGDLAVAEERRNWLAERWGVRQFLTIDEVLDGAEIRPPRKQARIVAVYGREFDLTGHEGQLQLTGATEHLERYAQAIRRLREAGFSRVVVVTDHGFFHWQPDKDEIEVPKPGGDLLWISRRAMVGRGLEHPTAVRLPVSQSDLDAVVPRSVNAFKTYGGIGFFHGGAMLQEAIIPVVTVRWPARASKVEVVLKPVVQIVSQAPRIQVEAGLKGVTLFGPDEKLLARRVWIKVRHPATGKLVFKHGQPVTVEPGGQAIIVQLDMVAQEEALSRGTPLVVEVTDADDEENLTREEVRLEIDIDEW